MSGNDDKPNVHAEAPDYSEANLATSWGSGENRIQGPGTSVIRPTKRQIEVMGNVRARTCGNCKYMDKSAFKSEAKATGFFRELIHGYQWKPEHLCDPPDQLGMCRQKDGTVVGPRTAACDHHRDK